MWYFRNGGLNIVGLMLCHQPPFVMFSVRHTGTHPTIVVFVGLMLCHQPLFSTFSNTSRELAKHNATINQNHVIDD
jgi:hypothetical protein